MLKRLVIIKLLAVILKPIVAAFKVQAEKTPNPIDDAIVEMAETILEIFSDGSIDEVLK